MKADIEGKVVCLGKAGCGSDLVVTLSLHGAASVTSKVSGTGVFKFTGILPATYSLSINEDGRCWENQVLEVPVSKDVKDLVFRQVGNYITVDSTRPTILMINDLNSKPVQESAIGKLFGRNVFDFNVMVSCFQIAARTGSA